MQQILRGINPMLPLQFHFPPRTRVSISIYVSSLDVGGSVSTRKAILVILIRNPQCQNTLKTHLRHHPLIKLCMQSVSVSENEK